MDEPTTKYVEISVCFLSFGEIDTMNEKYQAEILIESKWSLSKTSPGQISSVYDPKEDWNPKLYVLYRLFVFHFSCILFI